jgi:hypothetical protein
MPDDNDPWKEARDGFDKWLRLCCYLGGVWVFLDILKVLPQEIGDKIVAAILNKLGL